MCTAIKSRRDQALFTSREEYVLLVRTVHQFTPAEVASVRPDLPQSAPFTKRQCAARGGAETNGPHVDIYKML
jgi:hypothetical protein